jgi:hypothetical protein
MALMLDSPMSHFIRESTWGFQAVETVHVLAFIFVVGSITVVDLRLLGVASRAMPVTELARDTLKWTWFAFAIAFISGFLMVMAKIDEYVVLPVFWLKYAFMACAGINMLYFELVTYRGVAAWDVGKSMPPAAKIAGGLSLLFWALVIVCGRWIGFTVDGGSVFGHGF